MQMLATLTFDPARRAETEPLIPHERARLKELTEAGTVLALYLQADLARVWLVLRSEDEAAIRQALESRPLYPYVAHLDLAALVE
jgi:Muconolactone delta-isomerase